MTVPQFSNCGPPVNLTYVTAEDEMAFLPGSLRLVSTSDSLTVTEADGELQLDLNLPAISGNFDGGEYT